MSNPLIQQSDPGATPLRHAMNRNTGIADHEVTPPAGEAWTPRTALSLVPLGAVLDTLDEGILLVRSDSCPCFSNSAARRLLIADAERDTLAREIRSISRTAFSHGGRRSTEVEVATRAGRYRMRATLLLERIKEISCRAVLVTIQRAKANLPSREFLMLRFAMTAREAEVALLLARGGRNAAIATALRISVHTARHHTERVLVKLNVHSRGEVARALVDGPANDV